MDARFEGLVEFFMPVCRQEHDAGIPLHGAEEDGNKCIAGNVVGRPSSEKHVCFVDQKNGIPCLGKLEHFQKPGFGSIGVFAQLSTCQRKQRLVGAF